MKQKERIGWVLYDDTCGFCREWIPFWGKTLRGIGLDIAPLQAPWVADRLSLPPEHLVHDIRILFEDGTDLEGAAVYRYAVQHIWWAFPLDLFSVTPGLRQVWDWGYRTFRDNRHQFSQACGMPAPEPEA